MNRLADQDRFGVRVSWWIGGLVAVAALLSACGGGNKATSTGAGEDGSAGMTMAGSSGGGTAGNAGGASGTGAAAGTSGSAGAGAAFCRGAAQACTRNEDCCSLTCQNDGTCKAAATACRAAGAACAVATDCCDLTCNGGTCGATACAGDTAACASDGNCCSGTCVGGKCAALNTSCKTAGNACTAGADCCSKLCQAGKCALGASYCTQPGDVCYRSGDCCTGLCEIASGKTSGVCKALATTGAGGCTQDGVACGGDCTGCCSRVCAPYALSGVTICQPASGCKLTNNVCGKDADCCGGEIVKGDTVKTTCNLATNTTEKIGTCANPNGCAPRGHVCGIKEMVSACTNARGDCCDCEPPKFNCCKLDLLGIPRCFGGSTKACPKGHDAKDPNCCVKAGDTCAFSAECCEGTPCVPDGQGVLRCLAKPPGAAPACVATAGACTNTGDCCTGLTCNVPPGKPFGACGTPAVSGPPPGDAGAGETCAFYGQACSSTTKCCNAVPCTDRDTNGPCAAGSAACTCRTYLIQ